jgi:hypothetical protein
MSKTKKSPKTDKQRIRDLEIAVEVLNRRFKDLEEKHMFLRHEFEDRPENQIDPALG